MSLNQRVSIVTDLQFGSTGKGLLAGYLALRGPHTAVVTAWAPNAGHTFINSAGRKFVHTQLANAVVSSTIRDVFIGPGSVINPAKLMAEMEACRDLMRLKNLYIHSSAAVVAQRHVDAESTLERIGSTQKGSSAAVQERAMRDPTLMSTAGDGALPLELRQHVVRPGQWVGLLSRHDDVLVEGHQGYSLSIYHGMWPHVTSRDTTTHAILADCGMFVTKNLTVWGSLRTYPIRVANRYGIHGEMTGSSGPCYGDQHETTWEALGQTPELTTVTQRVRRVFTFSHVQVMQAALMNGVDYLFVNFMNYLKPEDRWPFLQSVSRACNVPQSRILCGYGPTESDVMECRNED